MAERNELVERFEAQRPRLRAVAHRMLGSLTEADDAVQEAWLRLSKTSHAELDDLGAWLTTVVARIALDMLRSRKTRNEAHEPDLIIARAGAASPEPAASPEQAALLADSVGIALLVVLETLAPAERVAFVLHDVFGMSFEAIAPIVERTPEAARQLASRARRRVQARNASADAGVAAQRSVVDAFCAAAQNGDFQGLVAVLDPEVILHVDVGATPGTPSECRGAEQVARRAQAFSRRGLVRHAALVNGAPGLICLLEGQPFSIMAFVVRAGKIAEIDIFRDPDRLSRLDLSALDGG